jgi:hypothetical protein
VNNEVTTRAVVRQRKTPPRKKKFIKMTVLTADAISGTDESNPDKPSPVPNRFLMAALRLWEIRKRMKE